MWWHLVHLTITLSWYRELISKASVLQVRSLLQDIEKAEGRLEASKMKERVLFHCATKRYLRALKAEWEKAEKAKSDAKKAAGKSKKKAGAATARLSLGISTRSCVHS